LNPDVTNLENIDIQFRDLDKEGTMSFLCDEKNFSVERVSNSIERLNKTMFKKSQSLEKWF
jgi:flap endonuclease-1